MELALVSIGCLIGVSIGAIVALSVIAPVVYRPRTDTDRLRKHMVESALREESEKARKKAGEAQV